MTVLDQSELQASPLADLHAIASQLGLDGYRRLRKADLVAAIVARGAGAEPAAATEEPVAEPAAAEAAAAEAVAVEPAAAEAVAVEPAAAEPVAVEPPAEAAAEPELDADRQVGDAEAQEPRPRSRRGRRGRGREREAAGQTEPEGQAEDLVTEDVHVAPAAESLHDVAGRDARKDAGGHDADEDRAAGDDAETATSDGELRESGVRIAAGEVELLGNGAAFLRVSPPEASDDDVYISAAQVRRCELVSGDRISGPVRAARRSERYPSLIRIDTINGAPAESVAEGVHYDDLPAEFPSERLSLGDGSDPTLRAIEWLTPLGLGSRCVIVGAARAGKTETLRRLAQALSAQEDLDVSLVLTGVRPEEIAIWRDGPLRPAVALSFAAPSESRDQAVERAAESARRIAARGGDAVLLIDTLDGLHPQVARRTLASARNITDGGSLTVIATAGQEIGGETTVIALDVKLTSSGRFPAVDLVASGTLAANLLVGDTGASAIAQARAATLESGG